METKELLIQVKASEKEFSNREKLTQLMKSSPIPDKEKLANLGLYVTRQNLSRYLFINELYTNILGVHGVIIEFGIRWGQNLALYESLRGIHEPYNYNRKIIGFDTFSGFPVIDPKDGNSEVSVEGAYAVTENYEDYLEELLKCHEKESPVDHIQKYRLIKGDATVTIEKYLKDHPETVIAMAYFDFDIYKPTKKCLEMIKPHLTKGSVVGFDELNHETFPGETLALKEVIGLDRYKLHHSKYGTCQAYIIID